MLILIVEDSKTFQFFLTQNLKSLGHEVISSYNGLDAIEKFKNNPVDLIFMDAEMPGCNGFETTQKIRAYESTHWIPLIFLSAHSENTFVQKAYDSGADFYLSKPVNDVELFGLIRAMARINEMNKEIKHLTDSLSNISNESNKNPAKDLLTGLANRQIFDQRLEVEIQHSQRHQHPLSVLLIKIDFFEQYKETYGNITGSNCLKKIADSLTRTFSRKTDLVANYTEDKFVVILPDTSKIQAEILAEKMRININNLQIEHKSSKISEFISVSIEVSTTVGNQHCEEISSLLEV